MEDYSRNVKFEKQRRNIMFFGVSMYSYICMYSVIYLYFFIKICYVSHLTLKLYSWKSLYDRYLPLEEALSREISTVSSSQEVFSSQYRDRNL